MGIFDKLFGGGKTKPAESTTVAVDCPHAVLVPRWDNVQDMGHEEKASRFMCEACHEEFEPEKARELQNTINERMDRSLEEMREMSAKEEERK